MGSNLIVIGTLIFLFVSAVLLILIASAMTQRTLKILSIRAYADGLPQNSPPAKYGDDTASLGDIQDFIKAKAEILYNGNAYAINTDSYKIGRSHNECNMIISDASVSRFHCIIEYHDNIFMLSDLNSSSGTYVNGERVMEPVELHDGDEIRMGYAVMTFKRRNERKADEGGAENPSQQTD